MLYYLTMRTSYSALETFKTCPLKYKYQEIDRIKTPKNVEAVFGSAVHSALKFMFQKSPLYPSLDQTLDAFRDSWDARKATVEFARLEDEQAYVKLGMSLLDRFYKQNPPWNFNAVELETRFETEIEDKRTSEKHILTGFIDRIDKTDQDTYEIIDYKTSKKMPSQKDLDENLQLSVYHLGLAKKWPHIDPSKVKLSLYFLKHREKISTSRNIKQLEDTKNLILKTVREIEKRKKEGEDFPPTPTVLCDWCGYRKICPMWRHMYAKEYECDKIKNEDELEAAIGEYFRIKDESSQKTKRLNELKNIIYAFMAEQKVERVFGKEGCLTKRVSEKLVYDMDEIKNLMEGSERWQEVLEPSEKKLIKLLPSLSDTMREEIEKIGVKKTTTILTASKSKNAAEDEEE